MKNIRRNKALSIALILLLLLPLVALCGCRNTAAVEFKKTERVPGSEKLTYGYYDYTLYDDGCAALTAYAGSEKNIVIPEKVDDHRVVTLGNGLFGDVTTVESVKIPDSVEEIGSYCFYGCTALAQITFGTGVWNVGVKAFDGTAWFKAQKDSFVRVNNTLIAYQGKETHVVLPRDIYHIGGSAFSMNNDIVSVDLAPNTFTIADQAFAYCGALVHVSFGEVLVSIGSSAFTGCEKMTVIDLPASVESLGSNAFSDCYGLRYACLGSSLTSLGEAVFYYCQRLTVVCIPATLEELHSNVFEDCYSFSLVLYEGDSERFDKVAINDDNNASDWHALQIIFNYNREGKN